MFLLLNQLTKIILHMNSSWVKKIILLELAIDIVYESLNLSVLRYYYFPQFNFTLPTKSQSLFN